jgi:tetratricopeptide (TPR) repeat protein
MTVRFIHAHGQSPLSLPKSFEKLKDYGIHGLETVAFLTLAAFIIVLYNWSYSYDLVLKRDTSFTFFIFDRQFLSEFLSGPGGLAVYAGRFLGQFYETSWLGPLLIAALVVGFGLLLHRVVRRFLRTGALFCSALACIVLATAFDYAILEIAVGLIAAVGVFLLYLNLPRGALRQVYGLAAIPGLYLLAGGSFWLFALWVIATEGLEGRGRAKTLWPLVLAALAAATPLAAWRWFFRDPLMVNLRLAFLAATIFAEASPAPALAFYGCLALFPFWTKALARTQRPPDAKPRRLLIAGTAALALAAVGLTYACYDSKRNEVAAYTEFYRQRQWDCILRLARTAPGDELMAQFFTDRALYEKGQLLDEMFRYPQPWGTRGLILNYEMYSGGPENDMVRAMYRSDLFFEMGHMNAALMSAYDNMEVSGKTYGNVKRLAECSMVEGNYPLAMKYLTMLERTLFYRSYARKYMEILADPKARELYFAEQRSLMPSVEIQFDLADFAPLLAMVKSDPANRMAADYLAAWCLLDVQSLPMLAENFGALKASGHRFIAESVQEGVLMLQALSGPFASPPEFHCDRSVEARALEFLRRLKQYPSKLDARQGLAAFSDMFMYYAMFEARPVNHAMEQFAVGKQFQAGGRTQDAISHFRQALEIYPKFAEAHAALAEMLKAEGRAEEAALHAREAARLKAAVPNSAPVRTPSPSTME